MQMRRKIEVTIDLDRTAIVRCGQVKRTGVMLRRCVCMRDVDGVVTPGSSNVRSKPLRSCSEGQTWRT